MGRDANLPVAVISEGHGHADIPTTQIYIDDFDNNVIDAASALVKFWWVISTVVEPADHF